MPTTTIREFPGLQRMVYPEEHMACFRIKIYRSDDFTVQEYFMFENYPSEEDALATAKNRWHELRKIYPVLSRRQYAEVERRKSSSGIVGVTRVTKVTKGHPYDFWRASYTDRRGVERMRLFSVNKYGDARAKEMAIEVRNAGLAEIDFPVP